MAAPYAFLHTYPESADVETTLGLATALIFFVKIAEIASNGSLEGLLDALGFTAGGTVFWMMAVILFGAPSTTLLARTFLFSLFVSLLTFLPIAKACKTVSEGLEMVQRAMFRDRPRDEKEARVFGMVYGTCIGAWLGALPIPLDWDEPWQAWPFTVYYGALAGWSVGRVVGPWALKVVYGSARDA